MYIVYKVTLSSSMIKVHRLRKLVLLTRKALLRDVNDGVSVSVIGVKVQNA